MATPAPAFAPNSRRFPPRDLGVLSPQRAAVHGDFAVLPWNSDGVRVLNIALGRPRDVASFVPPDVVDPTGVRPTKAYVVSVALYSLPGNADTIPRRDYILISDVNSRLYILEARWSARRSR